MRNAIFYAVCHIFGKEIKGQFLSGNWMNCGV
jgi:hypothetical protein